MSARTRPILVWFLAAYLFLLPLRSVEIPSIVAGFSINPARLIITLVLGLVAAHVAVHGFLIFRGRQDSGSAGVGWLVTYISLSLCLYYVLLLAGETIHFGAGDSFFRSYRGRPFAQLVSFLTYAVLPFVLIRRYARDADDRWFLERAFAMSLVLLIVYGYFQQASYYAGLPVTGRQLYEQGGDMRVPAYSAAGHLILRFYSLGGEPRDVGTLMIGGIPFLLYVGMRWYPRFAKLAMALGVSAIVMTASTSAFLAAGLTIAAISVDIAFRRKLRPWHVAAVAGAAVAIAAFVFSPAGQLYLGRSLIYFHVFSSRPDDLLAASETARTYLAAQSVDVGGLYYLLGLGDRPLWNILFGYGYGNYGGGMADVLMSSFGVDVTADPLLLDTRSLGLKMLVETGVLGLGAYFLVFWIGLKRLGRLQAESEVDRQPGAGKFLFLRYSYIGFFVASLIHISFYHFLVLGLILAMPTTVERSVRAKRVAVARGLAVAQ